MDIERPQHKTRTNTSDIFICFKSNISHSNSSSMRNSSKSNLNPSSNGVDRSSSTSTSLTTSLSRRLRHNGSLRKGAQSPALFPKTTKKGRNSSGFVENPEPSSPKVTCIGQVRVKTKKQGKKMKMLACRSKGNNGGINNGENNSLRRKRHGSFSEGIDNQSKDRNQRWVHLPLTICESLKGFGSEFSCLIPCKSSCFSGGNNHNHSNKRENLESENSGSSCGGVFRWMVSLQEGEEGKKDIELIVSGDNEEIMEEGERDRVMERVCSRRRSIFDDVEFDDLFNNVNNNVGSENNGNDDDNDDCNDGVRVNVCVPPKNALLLMRCRSDPMRMASLSQKFWDPPLVQHLDDGHIKVDTNCGEVDEKLEVEEDTVIEIKEESVDLDGEIDKICDDFEVVGVKIEALLVSSEEIEEKLEDEKLEIEHSEKTEEKQSIEEEIVGKQCNENSVIEEHDLEEAQLKEELNLDDLSSIETITVEEKVKECEDVLGLGKVLENEEIEVIKGVESEESCDLSTNYSTSCTLSEESTAESKELEPKEEKEEKVSVQEEARKSTEKENNNPMLPDCLLLMMCEPKLSMEVSKETWVCSNDFIRWLPERHLNKKPNKTEGGDDQSGNSNSNTNKKTKAAAVAALPPLAKGGRSGIQPGRSSISFPTGGASVANLIEQKLAKAGVGYEPCVLTRCKSAPLRSTGKFAPPELACSMWGRDNGRKLEPHKPAICGVGSAGVGF